MLNYTNKIMSTLNTLIQDIKVQDFKVNAIILFGSAARNELSPQSDIDFCIIKDGEYSIFGTPEENEVINYITDYIGSLCQIDFVRGSTEDLKFGEQVFDRIRNEGKVIWKIT